MRTITAKLKTIMLKRWIQRKLPQTKTTWMTSEALATSASDDLGFRVTPNRMCRELRKAGVTFKSHKDDPQIPHYTKLDVLRGKVDYLETRIVKLEKNLNRR
jgi:hypothetical protein